MAIPWMTNDNKALHFGGWQITEWLINYQAGFVRRGLMGEVIYGLGSGQDLLPILYRLTLIFFLIYCALFLAIYFLSKIRQPWVLTLAILIPGGLFQMGFTMQFFTRKEILFLILFSFLCLSYLRSLRDGEAQKKCWIYVVYVCAILGGLTLTLIHEGYLFMSYPLTVLLLWICRRENPQICYLSTLFYLYCLSIPCLFIFCAINHGDVTIAQQMWQSLSLGDRLILSPSAPYTVFGLMAAIGWGITENLLTIYGVFATGGWKYWLLFIIGNALTLALMLCKITAKGQRSYAKYVLLIIFATIISAGMFVVAADWGRWISFISNSVIIFAFTMYRSPFAMGSINAPGVRVPRVLVRYWTKVPFLYLLPPILLYDVFMRLPECCIYPPLLIMPFKHYFFT